MGCPLLCTAVPPPWGPQHPPSALPTARCHGLGGLHCPDASLSDPGFPFPACSGPGLGGVTPLSWQLPGPEAPREGSFQRTKLLAGSEAASSSGQAEAPDNTVRSDFVPACSSPPHGPCHHGPGPELPGAGREGAAHWHGQEGLVGVTVQGASGQNLPWAWAAGGQPAGSQQAACRCQW